jgi:hypothetical protein
MNNNDDTFEIQTRRPIQTPTTEQNNVNNIPLQSPIQLKGNVPPEFLRMAEEQKYNNQQNENNDFKITETSRMQSKKPMQVNAPNVAVTGSPKLEELIAGIKQTTQVYEKITLPSLGKFYSGDDGPTDGILHIRPMTGHEESILATPRFIKSGQAINLIFQNCIKEKYNPENFLSADRKFLLIWLRGISYSPDYEVELQCPFTDKKFNYTINLDLDVDMCPDDFNYNSLHDVLPTTNYKFSYRLSKGKDEIALQAHRDKKARFDTSQLADDTLIFNTVQLLEDIEGLTSKFELEKLMEVLPVSDSNYIRNTINEPPFGVNTKVTIQSPFTLEDFEIELPLDSNFFFPKKKKIN